MQKATHILDVNKFKKVAKGLHNVLFKDVPDDHKPPLGKVMQHLSKELFSVPYEEARVTILSGGGEPIISSKPTLEVGMLTPSDKRRRDYEEVISSLQDDIKKVGHGEYLKSPHLKLLAESALLFTRLKEHFPARQIAELRDVTLLVDSLERLGVYLPANVKTPEEDDTNMWDDRQSLFMESFGKALYAKCGSFKKMSLDDLLEAMSWEKYIDLAHDESVDKKIRAGMWTMLSSINYKRPTEQDPKPVQNMTTLEQFDYCTMRHVDVISMLKSKIKAMS